VVLVLSPESPSELSLLLVPSSVVAGAGVVVLSSTAVIPTSALASPSEELPPDSPLLVAPSVGSASPSEHPTLASTSPSPHEATT
jgi:hypothetical protein